MLATLAITKSPSLLDFDPHTFPDLDAFVKIRVLAYREPLCPR